METQTINIGTLNREALEALAYRLYKQRDTLDQSLNTIETELNRRNVEETQKADPAAAASDPAVDPKADPKDV